MNVLSEPLSLGTGPGRIEDVEALVNKVVSDRMRKWPRGQHTLNEHQRRDLVSYLIGVCWELAEKYDPEKDKRPNLASYAAHILNLRIADWYRKEFGDTRHGDRPVVLSLDAPVALNRSAGNAEDRSDRLVDSLESSTGDPAVDRSPDLVGLLHGGGGAPARTHAPVGEQEAGGAPGRDREGPAVKRPTRTKKQPRIAKTRKAPAKPPICPACYVTFLDVFVKVNAKAPPAAQLEHELLEERARKRSVAVKFGDEWACPRHTKLEDKDGQELMLQTAYPNRAARRMASGKTSRKPGVGRDKEFKSKMRGE